MQQRRRGKDKGPYRHFFLFSLPALTMPMSAPVQTSQLHFFWLMAPTAQMWLVNPTDYKGALKTREWKTQEWKTRHQTAGVENAGVENVAPECKDGKRESGKRRSQESEKYGKRRFQKCVSDYWLNASCGNRLERYYCTKVGWVETTS